MCLRPHLLQRYAQALQHAGGYALAFPQEADEQVLGTDISVIHPAGFIHRQLDHLLGPGSQPNLALRWLLAAADDELYGGAHLGQINAQAREDPGGHTFGFSYQPKQDVFGPDVVVVEPLGFFLRQRQNPGGPVRKISRICFP